MESWKTRRLGHRDPSGGGKLGKEAGRGGCAGRNANVVLASFRNPIIIHVTSSILYVIGLGLGSKI